MRTTSSYQYREWDGDSVGLDPSSPFFADHVSRYWRAGELARGKRVLDCACGRGQGSYILSKTAAHVTGVDLNQQALATARSTFNATGLEYHSCDILNLGQLGQQFDLVTAFEVLEHIPAEATARFLGSIASALRPAGVLLLSTPNHDVVIKSGVYVPPFHINNFKPSDLRRALAAHFSSVRMPGQLRRRGGMNRIVVDMDFLNLRHLIWRPVRSVLQRMRGSEESPPAVATPSKQGGPELFDTPLDEYREYLFSERHWRQAGLTVAICTK